MKKRSSVTEDLRQAIKQMFQIDKERKAFLKESLIAGNDEALKLCFQNNRDNLRHAWKQLSPSTSWPVVVAFFNIAKKMDPEQAFDLVEEVLVENPFQALKLYEEMTTSFDHYGTFRFEFILLQNDVIKHSLWRSEAYNERLIQFVERTGEMPPPSMIAAFILPYERRIEAECYEKDHHAGSSDGLRLFQRVMFRCDYILHRDPDLLADSVEFLEHCLSSSSSIRMKAVLSHYYFDNFPQCLEKTPVKINALDILTRASKICPDCFQITPLKLPEI